MSIVYPAPKQIDLIMKQMRYFPVVHLFFRIEVKLVTVHRKNAPALSSPDKNLITKELMVLFSFQEGALVDRIIGQIIGFRFVRLFPFHKSSVFFELLKIYPVK